MIDRKAIQTALDDPEPGNLYFLDRKLKKVVKFTIADKTALENLKKSVKDDPTRYAQVPKPEPKENYAEMEAFIATVHDPKLKEVLKRTQTSHRPFREFRDALDTKVKEKREWEIFHKKYVDQRIDRFLKNNGLI